MCISEQSSLSQAVADQIRSEYLGKCFTPDAFCAWVDNCLRVASDIEPSSAYYYHRLLKKVRQEGLPISMLLQSGLLSAKQVEPSLDEHANFDAKLLLRDGSVIQVEVTCFKDGQLDLARGDHLEKFGFAGVIGTTTKRLWQAVEAGEPDIGDAVDADERNSVCIRGIEDRITEKLEKGYAPGTILIVAFEGDFREATFKAILSGVRIPQQSSFSRIFLVSYSSKQVGQIL